MPNPTYLVDSILLSSSPKGLALLGSTGSIGTQALEVVREQRGRFRVAVLAH
ncbi:MAG: hypothetical protein EOO62_32905, partial [Hymenobacter sp.]